MNTTRFSALLVLALLCTSAVITAGQQKAPASGTAVQQKAPAHRDHDHDDHDDHPCVLCKVRAYQTVRAFASMLKSHHVACVPGLK